MNTDNNKNTIVIKPAYQRYISIDENIHTTLSLHSLSLYIAFRFEADYRKEDAEIRRSARFMYTKAKISRPHYYRCLNELESVGLLMRNSDNKLGEICIFHVARELGYFTKSIYLPQSKVEPQTVDEGGVSDRDRGVSDRDTYHYSFQDLNTNISEFHNSPAPATQVNKKTKPKPNDLMLELIAVYRRIFPDNPQPHPRVISTTLQKTLQTLIKRWPELDPNNNALDADTFERYLSQLRLCAPKFSLGEYVTHEGNTKKNGMETFCRWNTVVKFLENQYS